MTATTMARPTKVRTSEPPPDVKDSVQLLGNPAWVSLAAAGRFEEIHDYRKSDEDTSY